MSIKNDTLYKAVRDILKTRFLAGAIFKILVCI